MSEEKERKKKSEEKERKKIYQLKSLLSGSDLGVTIAKIKTLYQKGPFWIKLIAIAFFVLEYLFCGYVECKSEGYISPKIGNILWEGIDGFSIIFLFVIEVIFLVALYLGYSKGHSGQTYDIKRKLTISEEGTCGTAQKMTEEEKEEAFDSGDFETNANTVLGADPETKELYSVKEGYGINGNMIAFGSPGTGKTRCLINNTIFNKIRKGESVIVSDPKLEIYGKTAEMARAHEYTVKVFNTNPNLLLHSDGMDFLGIIGDNEFKIDAFVDTVMTNISGTIQKEFWDKSQMNELKFLTTYVATNNVGIPKTLGGIYQFMNTHTVEQLEDIFFNLPDDHPARPAFNTWAGGDKVVKGNTHGGLQIDLQKLSNKLIQKITGTNEIDLTLPGREKCIYYISMSDQESSMKWLTALYWVFQIKELVEFADAQKSRKLPIKVLLLLEEFYNIGLIPEWDSKISQLRGRGIDAHMYLQSLGQLQKMYPENVWESVIDCCSTMILLGTRSLLTAKYFSEYSGMQTVITTSYRYEKRKGIEGTGALVQTGTSVKERPLYYPDEIIRKNRDHILVSTSTYNMCELEKVDYTKHPMCQEIREVIGAEHIPDWVRTLDKDERELFKVDKEKYTEEGGWNIKLCTPEDLREEWTDEKEKALRKQIIEEKKRLGRYEEDDNMENRLSLSEDYETDNGEIEQDLTLTEEELKGSSRSVAIKNTQTGIYQKPGIVYNTIYESEDGITMYENEDHTVTPEEHEKRMAQRIKSIKDFEEDIDNSKIGNMFKNM